MDLFRDILDKQIIDHRQEPMGKVDGLVLELTDEGPPRVGCTRGWDAGWRAG
jgi:hypothetical protein